MFEMQRHWAIAPHVMKQTRKGRYLNLSMGTETLITVGALKFGCLACGGDVPVTWSEVAAGGRNLRPAWQPHHGDVITARCGKAVSWSAPCSGHPAAGGEIRTTTPWQVQRSRSTTPAGAGRSPSPAARESRRRGAHLERPDLRDKDQDGKRMTLAPRIQLTANGLTCEFVDRDDYTVFDFVADYRSGALGRKAVAIIAFDPAKYDAGALEKPAVVQRMRRVWNERKREWQNVKLPSCPTCGNAFEGNVPRFCPSCKGALFNFSRWRRSGWHA
jgi:hypothetical protein